MGMDPLRVPMQIYIGLPKKMELDKADIGE